jgi:hypothetical protein
MAADSKQGRDGQDRFPEGITGLTGSIFGFYSFDQANIFWGVGGGLWNCFVALKTGKNPSDFKFF